MNARLTLAASLLLTALMVSAAPAAESATAVDLKKAVPADVHMAVFGRHNSERDYQKQYMEEVWKTIEEERIGERIMEIVTSHVPKEKLEEAESAWEEMKEALEPIDCEAVMNAEEGVFAQRFDGPFSQSLFVVRLTSDGAADFEKGISQAFELFDKWGEDKTSVETSEVEDAKVTALVLPEKSPFHPVIARLDDVIFMSTNRELLRESVEQFQDEDAESKFDDPRLKEALEHLPEPEDALVFFDGKQLFDSLGDIGDFIIREKPDDEGAQRAAKVLERIIDEVAILDYEVTVEYTEDGQNRVAKIGKLADDADDKFLAKAVGEGEAFEDWQSWVPEEATSYSLSTGINLHILYEGIIELVREEFPESHEGLDDFEEKQKELDVHIDRDILQSFSGESVSVTLPAVEGSAAPQTVSAVKCQNPEKIRELLDRAVEGLLKIPAVQTQGLKLVDCEDLEDFQRIEANFFAMAGVKPVIGFNDGWMIVASSENAAEKLIAVREGDAKSIDRAESLEQFDLEETDDEVYAVSYSDVGEGIRNAADVIEKIGTMAPMFIGMAAAQADPEDVKPVVEALALLPSVAKVVRKFDFYEERLSVTHDGPLPDTYAVEAVTLIRQP